MNETVKTYRVRTAKKPDFSLANVAQIDTFRWIPGYEPQTQARMLFVPGDGFHLLMTCRESEPLARYHNFFDPVWTDSCMECFLSFSDAGYMNVEMNSNGAALIAMGRRRGDNERTPIDRILGEIPEICAEKFQDRWCVSLHLTLRQIECIFNISADIISRGFEFRGNFYKCGDECPSEHYGMWNPVLTISPDFHRPEYFGRFVIE